MTAARWKVPLILGIALSPLLLAGCSQTSSHGMSVANLTDSLKPSSRARPYRYTSRDKECLERAMFFESNRSSRDGMVAVGTVVMNRLRSGQYSDSICGVVGQKRQFAPGVMTRQMNSKAMPDVQEAAEAVLKGERAPKLNNAMHFHTAGLKFPYNNMHYITVAGGNAFYEKRGRKWQPLPPDSGTAFAFAGPTAAPDAVPGVQTPPVMVASAEPEAASATTASVAVAPAARDASAPDKQTLVASAAAAPLPEARPSGETPARQARIAYDRQPDAARFGGKSAAPRSTPFMTASASANEAQPVMSFESTPDDTSAIGALIVKEERPFNE